MKHKSRLPFIKFAITLITKGKETKSLLLDYREVIRVTGEAYSVTFASGNHERCDSQSNTDERRQELRKEREMYV